MIILLPFLLFWRWVFKGEVLFWGTTLLQFWPWHNLVKTSLLAGEWPLWNPFLGNGTPLLANLQTAFFYPLNGLYLLLPVEHGLTLSVILHLVLAGLFMYGYGRQINLSPFAATVSALTYMVSGYLAGRTQFVTMVNAAAWLPLLLLLSERLVIRPTTLTTVWLGLALAVQLLAGHAQLWFYSLWLIGAYTLFRSWQTAKGESTEQIRQTANGKRSIQNLKSKIQNLTPAGWRFGLAVGLALLLTAGQLLPTAELTNQSPRNQGAEHTFALTYSFWPWRLITLLAPNFFGHPAQGNYWGYANYWEDHAYVGVLPVLLAAVAIWDYVIRGLWRRSYWVNQRSSMTQAEPTLAQPWPIVPFFAMLIPISLILAMGWNTPIYLWIFNFVPGFSFFQAPARLLIWYTIAIAVLAGVGVQFFKSTPTSRRGWRRLLVACLGLTVTGLAGSFILTGRSQTFLTAIMTLGLWSTLSIILLLLRPHQPASTKITFPTVSTGGLPQPSPFSKASLWQWSLLGLIAFDLLWAAWPLNPTLPAAIFNQPIASAVILKAQPQGYRFFVNEEFDYLTKFDRYFRFDTFGPSELAYWQELKETLVPNLGIYAGLPSTNNYDPLVVGRWRQFIDLIQKADPAQRARLLALANTGYMIDDASHSIGPAIYVDKNMVIQAVPKPLPRAYFVSQVYPVQDETELLARLVSPNFDSRQEVIIMNPGKKLISENNRGSPEITNIPVIVSEPSANRISLQVEAPIPGFVVLTDTFYPGWQATVDGQVVPIWAANLTFRAVAVEAGPHEIVFNYQPRSFFIGLGVSTATLLATMVTGILLFKRKRRYRDKENL